MQPTQALVLPAAGATLLQELRLAGNRLESELEVRTLSPCTALRRLTLAGNPMLDTLFPRAAVALVRNACPGTL